MGNSCWVWDWDWVWDCPLGSGGFQSKLGAVMEGMSGYPWLFWEGKAQGKPWGDGSGSGRVPLGADGSSVLGWFNTVIFLLPCLAALPTVIPSLPWTALTCCACPQHWHFTVLGSMMNWAWWAAAGLHPRHLSALQHFPQANAGSSAVVIRTKEDFSKFSNSRNLGKCIPLFRTWGCLRETEGRSTHWERRWRDQKSSVSVV